MHPKTGLQCDFSLGALCIALAEILSFLHLYKMPWGGSVDLSMLPIILFCVRWGFAPGMVVSFAHAVFQMLFEGGIAIGWQSIIGDFILAYTVLGLAGLFKGNHRGLRGSTLHTPHSTLKAPRSEQ